MHITLIGNKKGIYIDETNFNVYIDCTQEVNYKDVAPFIKDVNTLVIYRDEDGSTKIVQAGGYSHNRGLFVNLYE